MIDERTEELAAFFVLGLLPANEAAAFEHSLAEHAELRSLVASLNNATLALAQSAPQVLPPTELKARLLTAMAAANRKLVPFPATKRSPWPWLIPSAAALAILGIFLWQRQAQQAMIVAHQTEISRLQQDLHQAETVRADLATSKQTLEQQAVTLNANATALKTQLASAEQRAAMSEQTRRELAEKFAALEASHQLDNARIAVLGSLLKDKPKAVAVSLWNQDTQDGLLVVENMPMLQAGKDYQLWIIDPNIPAPVSAGLFKVDAAGKGRLIFKPNQAIKEAGKFAVTEEKAGGVASPSMNKMVVIGG